MGWLYWMLVVLFTGDIAASLWLLSRSELPKRTPGTMAVNVAADIVFLIAVLLLWPKR